MCADAPDTSGVQEQARRSAELSDKAFNWYTQEYANTADDRADATKRANDVSDAQLAGMNYAMQQAKDADTYSKETYRPLEQKLVAESQTYDTPERRNQEASSAVAEVNRQVGAQRVAASQELARAGVAPDSMKSAAIMDAGSIGAAKAAAGADYTARKGVETQGYARMADAVSLGRNLPSQQATQQQIATTAGNAGVVANQGVAATRASGTSLMDKAFSTSMQGSGQAGQLFGTAGSLDNQARGQSLNFASSIFGSFMSDEEKKKGTGKPVDADKALDEVNALQVDDGWQYDASKGGVDDGGQLHTGPMAQNVRAKMGDAVAPDGKRIDIVSMNGKLLASMQALTKRVEKIEHNEHRKAA